MKKILLPMMLMFMFSLSLLHVNGQTESTATKVSPFAKGNYWFNAGDNFWFDQDRIKQDGTKQGDENSHGLNLGFMYFPVNHFGAGISFTASRDHNKETYYTYLDKFSMVYLHVLYGTTLGEKFNLYLMGSMGFGSEKSKKTAPSYTEYDYKYKDMSSSIEIGSPIAIGKGSGLYFTPSAGYEYHQTKLSGYSDKSMGPYLGTAFRVSLPCSSYAHNCSDSKGFSEGMYSGGSSFIGGNANILLRTGADKQHRTDGEGGGYDSDYNYSEEMLDLQYSHYILDNLAIGAGISLDNYTHNTKDNDYKYRSYQFNFSPQVQMNIPVKGELHNAFGFVEAGLGTSGEKYDNNGQATTFRSRLSDVSLGLGYNWFFARSFALTPFVEYRWNNTKDKDSKVKTTANGFEAGINIRHFYHY